MKFTFTILTCIINIVFVMLDNTQFALGVILILYTILQKKNFGIVTIQKNWIVIFSTVPGTSLYLTIQFFG